MTEPYYSDGRVTLHAGDCLDVLATLPDSSVDSVVTDPPYGLANTTPAQVVAAIARWATGDRAFVPDGGRGFMGKEWDRFVPPPAVWDECLRVLKPGGHALVFAGSRTVDLMTLGLRLAGFDIRDSIAWLYGSGFPKSHDVAKAIDKAAGVEFTARPAEGVGFMRADGRDGYNVTKNRLDRAGETTPEAERWQGFGTALKPGHEPIILARKPFKSTVAANVLEHGTGALNIDGCRIGTGGQLAWAEPRDMGYHGGTDSGSVEALANDRGRWPANVVLDETQAEALDQQSGERPGMSTQRDLQGRDGTDGTTTYGRGIGKLTPGVREGFNDTGGASRFFYTAKADSNERPRIDGVAHPTVKPLDLMRWLVRLVTPPGGKILDPFAGSGTTGEAALLEGLLVILIERETEFLPLITQRIHRRIDPVEAIRQAGGDLGLFGEPA